MTLTTTPPAAKRARHLAIRRIVAEGSVANQQELADRLAERGFAVTQATVSRDIAELGLVKVVRGDRHVYVLTEDLGPAVGTSQTPPLASDQRLHRILGDIPVSIARSGLILVLVSTPGTASVIAQAIDESSLSEQVGTVAGDNTLLVLFADETGLLHWQGRFEAILASAVAAATAPPATSTRASAPAHTGAMEVSR